MPLSINVGGKEKELTDEALVKMAEVTLKTKRAERGFALCQKDERIIPSKEHRGGPSSISYKDCPLPLRAVGSFHTHAKHSSAPSWYDGWGTLESSIRSGLLWLKCVGCPLDKTLRCIAPKEMPDPLLVMLLKREAIIHRSHSIDDAPLPLVETVLKLPIGEILKPKVKPPVAPPPVPAPPEVEKTPVYREGVIAGFDIVHPAPRRTTLIELIQKQHPEISRSQLENARIVYYDNYAQVRLP